MKFYQIRSINNGNTLGGFWSLNKEDALNQFFASTQLTPTEVDELVKAYGSFNPVCLSSDDVYVEESAR